jgi:hypothetical protein
LAAELLWAEASAAEVTSPAFHSTVVAKVLSTAWPTAELALAQQTRAAWASIQIATNLRRPAPTFDCSVVAVVHLFPVLANILWIFQFRRNNE